MSHVPKFFYEFTRLTYIMVDTQDLCRYDFLEIRNVHIWETIFTVTSKYLKLIISNHSFTLKKQMQHLGYKSQCSF